MTTEWQKTRGNHWYPKGTLKEPFLPQDIDDATLVFAAGIDNLLPPADMIPDEYCETYPKNPQIKKWRDFFTTIFYRGLKSKSLIPREGIDPQKAERHLWTIIRSYDPKHEYKEAAFCFLGCLWFSDLRWEAAE